MEDNASGARAMQERACPRRQCSSQELKDENDPAVPGPGGKTRQMESRVKRLSSEC